VNMVEGAGLRGQVVLSLHVQLVRLRTSTTTMVSTIVRGSQHQQCPEGSSSRDS
jgi:hypothetical protein